MIDLTARQKFILNRIIEEGPLNIKDLSQQIDVSSRTISREIAVINKLICEKNIKISENASILSINGKSKIIKTFQKNIGGIPLQWLLSQEQRVLLITAQLLTTDEPYKSAYFSYQINVVEGTISLYMDKIDEWLNVHNLMLKKIRGYGIEISGSEWNKRNSFVELLYEYKTIDELLSYIYSKNDDPTIRAFFKTIFSEKLITISKNLLELVNTEISNTNDIAYFSSFIHILLSLKRAKQGRFISLPAYLVQDIFSSNQFSIINKIREFLDSIEINLPDDELAYIAIQLMGNKYIYKPDRTFELLGISLEELSSEVVLEAAKKLNIKIDCDEQLILGLSQHFNPALYRINMGIQVINPLIDQIKEYYGNLFKTVNYACKLVFSKYNITLPQDEIGYITMHIGAAIERSNMLKNRLSVLVICPNGIGTAQILSSKIKSSISNIGTVTISSLKDWSGEYGDYDLTLSTVNIDKRVKNKNIITVSPFLQNEDIDKINDYIKKNILVGNSFNNITSLCSITKGKGSKKEKYDIINDILNNLQLELINTGSINELISLIAEDLFNKNLISNKNEIINLIQQREKIGNVVIPYSRVALLHTRSDTINKPLVGVYRLKESMRLKSIESANENVDTFIVMLARTNEHSYILEEMGKISISLIENKSFTEVLRLGDIKDLSSSLIKILNEEEI